MVKPSSSVDCEAQERKRTQNEGRYVGDEHLPEDESIAWTSVEALAPLQSLLCSLSQSLLPFCLLFKTPQTMSSLFFLFFFQWKIVMILSSYGYCRFHYCVTRTQDFSNNGNDNNPVTNTKDSRINRNTHCPASREGVRTSRSDRCTKEWSSYPNDKSHVH